MIDPEKLVAFDSSLTNLKTATDKATASNSDAVNAAKDAANKASVSDADFGALQANLDHAIAAGVSIGLKVNTPVTAAAPA
jgi:hypothetical protein